MKTNKINKWVVIKISNFNSNIEFFRKNKNTKPTSVSRSEEETEEMVGEEEGGGSKSLAGSCIFFFLWIEFANVIFEERF